MQARAFLAVTWFTPSCYKHAMMQLLNPESIPTHVVRLCERLREAGAEAYVVGGAVRDLLLGREVSDWDVATSALPEKVQTLFARTVATGLKHGTVTVLCSKRQTVEITTFRGEGRYSDGRHPDSVEFVDDIADDLSRRDFTINAMAYDPIDRELVDPFDGAGDLRNRCIRAVGDARERMREDALRLLRAVRFAAVLEFTIEMATKVAITDALDAFPNVSAERVREELFKLLGARRPSIGLKLMIETGLAAHVLPEIAATMWPAALCVCDALPAAPPLRLVGLLTASLCSDACIQPEQKIILRNLSKRLRVSNEMRKRVEWLAEHSRTNVFGTDARDARRFLHRVGLKGINDLFALREAQLRCDSDDRIRVLKRFQTLVVRTMADNPALTVRQLAVRGDELAVYLGCGPGPHLGHILDALLERVVDEPELNEREFLLALAKDLK